MKICNSYLSISILLVVLSAVGCKKTSPVKIDKYSNVLNRVAIVKTMDLKMYTNQAEITDTARKSAYIRKYSQYFNLDKTPHESSLTVTLMPRDTVRFSNGGYYSFTKNDNQFVFTSKELVQQAVNDSLFKNIFMHKASYTPFNLSVNQVSYHTHDIRVGYGDTTKLTLPVVSYRITRGHPYGSYVFVSFVGIRIDDFNPSIIQSLGPQDTIAVQLFNYELKAQLLNP